MSNALTATTTLDSEGWERSDFPIVCETCLGDNPYVRMMTIPLGKECKICERPFTIFRWRAGRDGRYKKTEVCQTCAKMKHVCQTCLLDLTYGLPVEVRDKVLREHSGTNAYAMIIPKSEVNRQFLAQQNERTVEQGGVGPGVIAPEAHKILLALSNEQPYYQRNRAHICTFFLRGECKRGDECPYRHEIPQADPELATQNFKDRYYGTNDPVAAKMLRRGQERGLPVSASGVGGTGGRFGKIVHPADKSITTLCVMGVEADVSENDIRGLFSAFPGVSTVRMARRVSCAFVTFMSREVAEEAADELGGKDVPISVSDNNGQNEDGRTSSVRINWAKPQDGGSKIDNFNSSHSDSGLSHPSNVFNILPTPGSDSNVIHSGGSIEAPPTLPSLPNPSIVTGLSSLSSLPTLSTPASLPTLSFGAMGTGLALPFGPNGTMPSSLHLPTSKVAYPSMDPSAMGRMAVLDKGRR